MMCLYHCSSLVTADGKEELTNWSKEQNWSSCVLSEEIIKITHWCNNAISCMNVFIGLFYLSKSDIWEVWIK